MNDGFKPDIDRYGDWLESESFRFLELPADPGTLVSRTTDSKRMR